MIYFKAITPSDRELLTSFIAPSDRRDSNLSVASMCCWQFLNCSSFAIIDGQLVIRFCFPDHQTVYTLPGGEQRNVIGKLAQLAMDEKVPLCLYGVIPDMQPILEREFPGVFGYREKREHFDYLYVRKDLSTLQGKGYQPKRNHVNKFKKSYDYRFTPMTEEMTDDCLKMYDRWCEERSCEDDETLEDERKALIYGMKHFLSLGLTGGAIWVDGEVIAFTFGSPVNSDTFCIHAEKAFSNYDGAYNTINKEFAGYLPERYVYLNREEDLGLPGLRKAKQSYRPVKLLEKGLAICAEGDWERLL